MFNEWLQSIKTMSIFLVCAQTLIHFKPKGAYEKYIRLLVSVMLLVQLLEPIGSLLGILRKGELQNRMQNIERRLEWIQQQEFEIDKRTEKIWELFLQEARTEQQEEENTEETTTES